MKGLATRFAGQLARPHGLAGRLIGAAMDLANRRPTELALDLLAPQEGERILDAGCGTGATIEALLQRAKADAVGIDCSPTMISAARRRLGDRAMLKAASIQTMPFPAASFDALLLLNVLYFSDRGGDTVRSLHRVLRAGGRLVAYVTDRKTMQGWAFAGAGYHRLFDREDLIAALEQGGFVAQNIWVQEVSIARAVTGLLVRAER